MLLERKYLTKAHPGLAGGSAAAMVEPDGRFTCWAAVSGNRDLQDDTFVAGAFGISTPTRFPLLAHHQDHVPIGIIDVSEEAYGLRGHGRLNLDVQAGREMRALVMQGAVTGVSVGFRTTKAFHRNGVRHITNAELRECSLVVFPANPLARVTSMKAAPLSFSSSSSEEADLARISDLIREMTRAIRGRAA